jgi:lysophospholipase L1-like esterase
MSRKLMALFLLLGLYTLLSVFVLELGLRLFAKVPPAAAPGFFWRAPDPLTGWSLQPNTSGRWYNAMYEFDVEVHVNELGIRAPDSVSYTKSPDVYRILVLGDSFVEAVQVSYEQTFGQQLAELLNNAGASIQEDVRRIEVINVGTGSWGNDQQLLWLRHEGYKYSPDLVILAFFPANDYMNNYMPLEFTNQQAIRKPWFEWAEGQLLLHDFPFDPEKTEPGRRRLGALAASEPTVSTAETVSPGALQWLGAWLHQYSALHRYLDPRLRAASPGFASWLATTGLIEAGRETADQAQGEAYIPVAYGIYANPLSSPWPEALVMTRALLDEFKKETRQLGIPLRGLLIPAAEELVPGMWEQILKSYPAMQAQSWSIAQPAEQTKALFADAGIPLLDLAPIFRQQLAEGNTLFLHEDRHFTPAGHTVAAYQLARWLTQDPTAALFSAPAVPNTLPVAWGHLVWRGLGWTLLALLGISVVWSIYRSGPLGWLRNTGLMFGTAGELLVFFVRRQNFVLLPLVVILLIFGGLLVVAQASVVGPFIYTLF